MADGRRPSLVAALQDRLRGYGSALAFAVASGFLLVIPGLILPGLTQVFIDEVLIGERSDWLRPLIGAILITVAVQTLLKMLQLRCLRRLHIALSASLSAQFFKHLLQLPVDFYAQALLGEISNRNRLNGRSRECCRGSWLRRRSTS